jgi:hypothetical protein
MNTQDHLDNLDKTLQAEGISDEERFSRVQILKECIEFAEQAPKFSFQKKNQKPARQIKLAYAIEMSIWALVVGWFAGIFTLHYCHSQ